MLLKKSEKKDHYGLFQFRMMLSGVKAGEEGRRGGNVLLKRINSINSIIFHYRLS